VLSSGLRVTISLLAERTTSTRAADSINKGIMPYYSRVVVWFQAQRVTPENPSPYVYQRAVIYSMDDLADIEGRSDFFCKSEAQRSYWRNEIEKSREFFDSVDQDLSWLDSDTEG